MPIKKIIAWLLKPLSSTKRTQFFFELLYRMALFGLLGDEWDFMRNGELRFAEWIAKRQKGNAIVFDVGANEGRYCEELLHIFDKASVPVLIHGFEPAADTYSRYQKRFQNTASVKCNNIGLGDKEESVNLFKSKDSSGFATLYQTNKFNFNSAESIELTTIDNYCSLNSIDGIVFLKMDVEGHEFAVLRGAKKMIDENKIQIIQFEFGAGNISSRTYFKDFFDLLSPTYNIYRIVKNGLIPISRYNYSLEVFGRVTNYAAVNKLVDFNT